MQTVLLEIFHFIDVAAGRLVPHLQFAVLLMHAQPNCSRDSGCTDVEIPPSDERITLLLRKGWTQERADKNQTGWKSSHPGSLLHIRGWSAATEHSGKTTGSSPYATFAWAAQAGQG